jgi:hypothetical protein
MRRFLFLTLPFVCLLAAQAAHAQAEPMYSILLTDETENNTPACAASYAPPYCVLPPSNQYALPFSTSTANQNPDLVPPVQTVTVDSVGHVELPPVPFLAINALMPPVAHQAWGVNGKVICEYQPWFSVNPNDSFVQGMYYVSPYNGHQDIDYGEDGDDSNNPYPSAGPTQDTAMISQGCNIELIDFYGFFDTTQVDVSHQFNLDTTNHIYLDLASRYNPDTMTYPMQFAIMEDKGAFQSDCNASNSNTAEETCIQNAIESEMGNINSNYIDNPAYSAGLYWTDHGVNVVVIFASCSDFSPSATPPGQLVCPSTGVTEDDWQTIWTNLMNDGIGTQYNMKFIFPYGQFGYPAGASSGEFAWPQPFSGTMTNNCQAHQPAPDCFTSDPTTQFWWCDSGYGGTELPCEGEGSGSQAYLDRFYTDAASPVNADYVPLGVLYKGFDDSNAGWGKDRVIAQQCGGVLLGTANELTYELNPNNTSYWASHQLPYMQVATWNDYEEGTEVESGINNC